MKNKPPYAIDSVDHALHLAQVLQQEGVLRVTDAAERVGVSVSTAHRLLAMLVYRDFADQGDDRRYRPGPVLRPTEATSAPVALLRQVALPHLRDLVDRVHESANLVVLVGTDVRFVATAEADRVLRVGDRSGRVLPARLSSGGKAILATMPAGKLEDLYASEADVDLARLRRDLALVRRRGFAINDQRTETGLTAVGMAFNDASGEPNAAVSIAMPTARFHRDHLAGWVEALSASVTKIEADLATEGQAAAW